MSGFEKPKFNGFETSSIFSWASLGLLLVMFGLNISCSPQKKSGASNPAPKVDKECQTFYDDTSCQNASNCQWTGASCSGTFDYCAKFVAQSNCPLSCQWNTTNSTCQPLSQQSSPAPCSSHSTQQVCSQYFGCVWNGYNCINSSGTTTGTPYPTTGNPYPTTTGSMDPTTGTPAPTTGTAPVTFCAELGAWQCLITQGCRYALLPSPGCIPQQ